MDRLSMSSRKLFFRSLLPASLSGAVIAIAIVFSACTKKTRQIELDTPHGKLSLPISETLRINLSTEPPTLDWNKATDTVSSQIVDNIMAGLVSYDLLDKNLRLRPSLAAKWESSKDAKKWIFNLRNDVVWTDGVPFQAQQVVDSWRRLLEPQTASEYAYFLFAIKNAKAFNEGKIKDFSMVGVRVLSPAQIEVELDQPMAYFPSLLTHSSTYPIRLDLIQKFGDKWTDAENMQGLGPFKLRAWQHDKMIVLERNDKFFGERPQDKNLVKYIAAYMIIEQSTAINLFDSGQLDALDSLPSAELKTLSLRPEFSSDGILRTYFYGLNVAKAPLNNPLVRQALAYAIDRKELVQILAGGQIPIQGWLPPGVLGYEADRGLSFSPQKARELLQKAGFSDLANFPKLTLGFNTNEDNQRIGENIQAQLKKNLGISIELKNEEWKVFLNSLKTDAPHIFRSGWQADFPDPDNFMNLMTSFSENNRTKWKNKKFDDLVKQGSAETSVEKRIKIYSEAARLLVEEEAPVIPLFNGVSQHLISSRVEHYPVNSMTKYIYTAVTLKR